MSQELSQLTMQKLLFLTVILGMWKLKRTEFCWGEICLSTSKPPSEAAARFSVDHSSWACFQTAPGIPQVET
nr:hypothetical protein Iba_chr12aCG17130 [Ipomoea batatas]GMD66878.1 hypothetical protein Iba_chr12cCG19240 [Ipomoea batatas]